MGFDSGSISFRRYAVVGDGAPAAADQALLDKLAEHALRPTEVGVPEDVEYGWSGGRHVLDGTFSFDRNVFADALHFALRVDTNRVPAELKRAYQIMEEDAAAAGNPSQFVSKKQKRDAKDVVRRKVEDDLRSGQFRRSRLTHVLWDLPTATVCCAASASVEEKLREIFERTFGLELAPLSAGAVAMRVVDAAGRRRDVEDLRPTRFVTAPRADAAGEDENGDAPADYPWVAKSAEQKDFLGNEFLLWLWHEADRRDGYVAVDDGTGAAGKDEIAVMFDRALDLDCAFAVTGKASLRSTGPAKMPEAAAALRAGKVPRKCGLTLEHAGSLYAFNLSAETLAVSSLKLPEVPEADTPRVLFEERIGQLRDFNRTFDRLFGTFVRQRIGGGWEGVTNAARRWIADLGRTKRVVSAGGSAGGGGSRVQPLVEVELATP